MGADEEVLARAQAKRRLESKHGGWRFWWQGGKWHAHPRPVVHGDTELEIDEAVTAAHLEADRHLALRYREGTGVPER